MLYAFGDESHDQKMNRFYAVSVIVGTQEEWDNLAISWNKRIKGIAFHASDCDSDLNKYQNNTHEENKQLYCDLTNMLAETKLVGYGTAIDIESFRSYFPERADDIPYLCFHFVIGHFVRIASRLTPQEKISFTFDINTKTNPGTAALYQWLISLPEWQDQYAKCIDSVTFATDEDRVEIQAADLYSREIMKYYDEYCTGKRDLRKSIQALFDTGRYKCDLMDRKFIENWKNECDSAEVSNDLYNEWLLKNRLKDNAPNRYKFLINTSELWY